MLKRVMTAIGLVLAGLSLIAAAAAQETGSPDAPRELAEGFVYFTDSQGVWLKSETIRLPSDLDAHQTGRLIVQKLFDGPSGMGLVRLWSEKTRLNAFFITDDAKAYVDLDIPGTDGIKEIRREMDTRKELLALYSLVNSLAVNIPQVKQVKILIRGTDAQTLAGHLDTDYFYTTNMLIVK